MKAIQIIARANQMGILLSPRSIFDHQTIAELAMAAEAIRDTSARIVTHTPAIQPIGRQARVASQKVDGFPTRNSVISHRRKV